MDAPAVSCAAEMLRVGEVAGAGAPADVDSAEARDRRRRPLTGDQGKRLTALVPSYADVTEVAEAVTRLVAMEHGTRPPRTHMNPTGQPAHRRQLPVTPL
ncbi:hypothetical protein GCM10010129_68550 [Streptomyces fumigatiscleroticus]|nr:hypothetical protein GCM10010129_68550 [Streptomyces fumigatiscleroticus]